MQFAICNPNYRRSSSSSARRRLGGVYIAVLGSALIISLLGLTALVGQRIQNRNLKSAADIRQAQMNANTAVELALLIMKQESNWRTNRANGDWFTNRGTAAGTCSVNVTDPVDSNLVNNATDPVVVLGIGYRGQAQQRMKLTIDPRTQPLGCLRTALAATDAVSLSSDTLRTDGLISANTITASASQVYGKVEAVSVSGSTYNGTTTLVTSASRPTMPTWSSVFNHYRTNGTELSIGSLPTSTTNNFGKNSSIETGTTYWTGSPTGIPTADINQSNNQARTGSYSLRVQNRDAWYAGAAQYIDQFVEPGQQYYVQAYVYVPLSLGVIRNFHISLYTKGSGSVQLATTNETSVFALGWRLVSGTVTAPAWSGNLEYAFIKIGGADSTNVEQFYLDDLTIRESLTGRLVYQNVLTPSVNTIYSGAPTNASEGKLHGIYWIDCGGADLVIKRSRIMGTLLVVNPGADSQITGSVYWSPAVAGYPALLVDADTAANADFTLRGTNRALSEKENGVDYNLDGITGNYIYPSEIRGLVAIEDDLTYENRSLVRGVVLVGDDISNSSGELEIAYDPESLLSPPPGFLAPYLNQRRPSSGLKAVLP